MSHLATGLAGTKCDAWEHYVRFYEAWKKNGKLPVMVGTTDTHSGTFGWPERTLILAPSPEGNDLAKAIRRAKVIMISPRGGNFFYGSDKMLKIRLVGVKRRKSLESGKSGTSEKCLQEC